MGPWTIVSKEMNLGSKHFPFEYETKHTSFISNFDGKFINETIFIDKLDMNLSGGIIQISNNQISVLIIAIKLMSCLL